VGGAAFALVSRGNPSPIREADENRKTRPAASVADDPLAASFPALEFLLIGALAMQNRAIDHGSQLLPLIRLIDT
jgi:hypothetical protein